MYRGFRRESFAESDIASVVSRRFGEAGREASTFIADDESVYAESTIGLVVEASELFTPGGFVNKDISDSEWELPFHKWLFRHRPWAVWGDVEACVSMLLSGLVTLMIIITVSAVSPSYRRCPVSASAPGLFKLYFESY